MINLNRNYCALNVSFPSVHQMAEWNHFGSYWMGSSSSCTDFKWLNCTLAFCFGSRIFFCLMKKRGKHCICKIQDNFQCINRVIGEGSGNPVFLPGEFHGQRRPAGYSPQDCRVRPGWATEQVIFDVLGGWWLELP